MIKNSILFQNYDLEEGGYLDDARLYFEEEGEEPTDYDVYNLASDFANDELDDVGSFISKELENKVCMMAGYVGRWDGRVEGWEIGSFDELAKSILKDCDYLELGYDEDGVFYLRCSHHDGTNKVSFRVLTDEGNEVYNAWEFEENYKDKTPPEMFEMLLEEKFSFIPQLEPEY